VNISDKELERLMIETQNDNPAKTTIDILEYIKLHKTHVIRHYPGYIKYFEDYYDVLNSAMNCLNYLPKKSWPRFKSLQHILFPETLKTLHRAFEDCLDGYYDESVILLRSVYEMYIRMIFVVYYPEDWEAIFFKQKGKRAFNLTNFVRDDLKFDWEHLYGLMSYIAHTKAQRNLNKIIEIAQGKFRGPIRLEYSFDENELSGPMNISTFLLFVLFHLMCITFQNDFENSSLDEGKKTRIIKIDLALKKWSLGYQKALA